MLMMDNDGNGEMSALQRKKLEALMRSQQQEAAIKSAMARLLDSAAYDRLMNVRIASPELYAKAVNAVAYAAQRTRRKLTESELLSLLASLSERRESEISIRRK